MSEPNAGYAEAERTTAHAIIRGNKTVMTIMPPEPSPTIEAAIEALIGCLSDLLMQLRTGREGASLPRQPTQPTPRFIGEPDR